MPVIIRKNHKSNLIDKLNKIDSTKTTELKQITSELISYVDILNLDEVFQILALRPGDLQLVETLMLGCNREIPKYSFSLFVALHENLKTGHLETAKKIASITIETFNIRINLKQIIDLGNVDFANFIHEKYEDYYRDNFGTSQTEFLPVIIRKNHKSNLIDKLNKIDSTKTTELKQITSELISYVDILNLDEVFQILALNTGDAELVETLMLECNREIPKYSFSLFVALHENLNAGHLETAKKIASITIKTFNIRINIKQIIDLGNVDFANFIHEKYEDYYRDNFGTSQTEFLSVLINNKQE